MFFNYVIMIINLSVFKDNGPLKWWICLLFIGVIQLFKYTLSKNMGPELHQEVLFSWEVTDASVYAIYQKLTCEAFWPFQTELGMDQS